jgi:hypothetical protein
MRRLFAALAVLGAFSGASASAWADGPATCWAADKYTKTIYFSAFYSRDGLHGTDNQAFLAFLNDPNASWPQCGVYPQSADAQTIVREFASEVAAYREEGYRLVNIHFSR